MPIDSVLPEKSATALADNPGASAAERARIADFDSADALVDLSLAGYDEIPKLTVIVPTRNEKYSIELLLARLGPAVAPLGAELIFVDDSDDETPDVLAKER